jgi:hypothetical protein
MDGLPFAYQHDLGSSVDSAGFEAPGRKVCLTAWLALRSRACCGL